MTGPRRFASITLFLAAGALVSGQQQAPSFRSSIDVVPLYVSVSNENGAPLTGLEAADFSVFDNGSQVSIAGFAAPPQAFVLRLLVSDSSNMTKHSAQLRPAAEALIDLIGPSDLMGVATLCRWESPNTVRRREYPNTADHATLRAALPDVLSSRAQPGLADNPFSWTAIYKSFEFGLSEPTALVRLRHLWGGPTANYQWADGLAPAAQVIMVLSSGMDYWPLPREGVHPMFEEMMFRQNDRVALDTIRRGIIVFGMGFNGTRDDKRLQKLSADSSGWFTQPTSKTHWRDEMSKVVADLRGRYLLGFVPAVTDGADHTLQVRVSTPRARVRARTLYRAPKMPAHPASQRPSL